MKVMVLKRIGAPPEVYKAAPMSKDSSRGVCYGCAFNGNKVACKAADDCVTDNIIWIKKEEA